MSLLDGLDALLVTNPTNIRYLTGFVGVSTREREAYVLVTRSTLYLFTHALYREQARILVTLKQIRAVEISREEPLSNRLMQILAGDFPVQSPKKRTLGFEETDVTVAEYHTLEKELSDTTLAAASNRVERERQIKQHHEIHHIKEATKLTDLCFEYIQKQLKPGVTEAAVAWQIESFFRKYGAESAFLPIVAFGENSSQPHHASSPDIKLADRCLILLDFGARVAGYCADMTRVVFMGIPTPEQENVYQTVYDAQRKALDELTKYFDVSIHRKVINKISGAHLDRIAREHIEKAGLPPYPHSLGHSVGLEIHEGPRLSVKKDEVLKPGMVFTVEPAVYMEGRFGIRIEDLVLMKVDGIEVLSKSPKELTVL